MSKASVNPKAGSGNEFLYYFGFKGKGVSGVNGQWMLLVGVLGNSKNAYHDVATESLSVSVYLSLSLSICLYL